MTQHVPAAAPPSPTTSRTPPSPSPPRSPSTGSSAPSPCGTALDTLVAELTAAPSGVAAAVNETVVPRGRWSATTLADGDRVEVLTAVQGG